MALAAVLARAAARLLRASPRPAADGGPMLSRSRLLSGLGSPDEPSHDESSTWTVAEVEILRDIEPVVRLVQDILHSSRYGDGGFLSPNDEKAIVEKLLAHHPRSEDKIGCGLDGIMVDRHPNFKKSRCLFVVQTNGDWVDFSYRKCLQAYIQEKYPSHAERFIQEHLVQKHSSLLRRSR